MLNLFEKFDYEWVNVHQILLLVLFFLVFFDMIIRNSKAKTKMAFRPGKIQSMWNNSFLSRQFDAIQWATLFFSWLHQTKDHCRDVAKVFDIFNIAIYFPRNLHFWIIYTWNQVLTIWLENNHWEIRPHCHRTSNMRSPWLYSQRWGTTPPQLS